MKLWAFTVLCWTFVGFAVLWQSTGVFQSVEPHVAFAQSPSDRVEATVTRVVDGDTIEVSPAVEGVEDVRLIGVDTPEVFGGEEPCGPEASAYTKERLEGQIVSLEFDEERTDQFGRALAYVFVGDELFNETLVREGFAEVATFEPNVRYEGRFVAAEEEARAAGIGLWNPAGPCAAAEVERAAPAPVPSPTPSAPPASRAELLEAGGSVSSSVPQMPGGGCPEEFPIPTGGGCWKY